MQYYEMDNRLVRRRLSTKWVNFLLSQVNRKGATFSSSQ